MIDIKQQSIRLIESLPDDITLDNIMEELYFKMQIDSGLKDLDEGKSIPQEEVEQRMSKWLIK